MYCINLIQRAFDSLVFWTSQKGITVYLGLFFPFSKVFEISKILESLNPFAPTWTLDFSRFPKYPMRHFQASRRPMRSMNISRTIYTLSRTCLEQFRKDTSWSWANFMAGKAYCGSSKESPKLQDPQKFRSPLPLGREFEFCLWVFSWPSRCPTRPMYISKTIYTLSRTC